MEQKETLLRLRKAKGLSQGELAEELGITRQTVSRWEVGLALPSAENLIGLSRVYGIPAEKILGSEAATEAREGRTGGKRFWSVAVLGVGGICALLLLWGICSRHMLEAVMLALSACNISIIALVIYGLVKVIESPDES